MRFLTVYTRLATILGISSVFLVSGVGLRPSSGRDGISPGSKITIDYPLDGSVFPPEIAAPTFLWRDSSDAAKRWVVEVSFANHSAGMRMEAAGEHWKAGEIDTRVGAGEELSHLTAEQAATRTWKPDGETWAKIKQRSVKGRATVVITGFAEGDGKAAVSSGKVTISTSIDPVGAPIFYRDVPLLIAAPGEKGAIQPLPPFAIPLIKWRLRDISKGESRTVMENLPTCANCHSFSRDGKTLGLDLDGPKNDKGLYALVPVTKDVTIRNQDVIRWSSFQENPQAANFEPAVKRFGFMSQISPDGRYVVTSIGPPATGNVHGKENPGFAPGLSDRLFSMNYPEVAFTQVFYPTRGILAWYDRKAGKLRPLPGADDSKFVHTSAFWSPDGKYLIFSRAEARDPYPDGAEKPDHANDPREPQIQYDLYRIPFNEGRGGKAEPVVGASRNGMSNNFPKVSPDGRWIVFVQNHNGLLMRPDSQLYIVPFAGGKARRMKCNTARMNSWHSFSPNGRWLAFSSKARSPYTQLMLTHIDAQGNDTPAVMVENTTAANRGVNIPEFVNIPPDGLEHIDPQATEFYRLFDKAYDLVQHNQLPEAIEALRQALERDPDDALAHYALGTMLSATNQEREAVEEYRKACVLNPHNAAWFSHLAVSQAMNGDLQGAIANWHKSLELEPSNAETETELGTALFESGQVQEGYEHLRKAVELAPNFPDGHDHLGWALAQMGQTDEGIAELQKAVTLQPNSVEYRYNLGFVLGARGDFKDAVSAFQKTVELTEGKDWRCLSALAEAYYKSGQSAEAVQTAQQAVDLAVQEHNQPLEKHLREALEHYEHDGTAGQPK